MKSFEGTSVLITGASRGLGRALAEAFAARGARVVMVARDREALERTARSIAGDVHPIAADLREIGAPQRIASQAAAVAGPIDVLINNASTLGPVPLRLLLDLGRSELEDALRVNLVAPFHLAQIAGGSMALRGTGTIVNISSDAAVEPYPRWGAYGASKAALDHLSRILAAELSDAGVRVLAIDPGEMNTDMHRDAIPDADPNTLADPKIVAEQIIGILESNTPSGARIAAQSWRSS